MLGGPGYLWRQTPFVPQPHAPADVILAGLVRPSGRIYLLVLVEEADARVTVIAPLGPCYLANTPGFDRLSGLPVGVIGRSIGTDLDDLPGMFTSEVTEGNSLIYCVRHGLLAIDVLTGFEGVHAD